MLDAEVVNAEVETNLFLISLVGTTMQDSSFKEKEGDDIKVLGAH